VFDVLKARTDSKTRNCGAVLVKLDAVLGLKKGEIAKKAAVSLAEI
jgi:hypothetical protein